MRVIIFNDVQNFNGSLNFINKRFGKNKKRFWNYKKYIPFLVEKLSSIKEFSGVDTQLIKTRFYEGQYSSNLIKKFKWSCHQRISEINNLINREQALLNIVSQGRVSNMLRKKVNFHVGKIKEELIRKKRGFYKYIEKQERNFDGQKSLFEELEDNPLIEVRHTPLKQSNGEVYQKRVDVLLATDLVHLAHIDAYDVAVVLSGDTDLMEAVRLVKNLDKQVIVFSYHTPGNPGQSNISDLMNHGKFINMKDFS